MKVTRTIYTNVPEGLIAICKAVGYMRADIWRRYGTLGTIGDNPTKIRAEIVALKLFDGLQIDGTIRNETIKDIVNDILTYKAAAKLKVRRSIAKRTNDKEQRKRLYTLLKKDEWLTDSFLHRCRR